MADRRSVQNSSEIVLYLSRTSNKAGQNVGRHYSSEKGHKDMMTLAGDGSRIIDWGYREVGVGTAQGPDGMIYVCETLPNGLASCAKDGGSQICPEFFRNCVISFQDF
eukprot:CAMPEP_0194300362 /NCGR_PEP_ID=MMETSP0169-20130528/61214_1 /TAXON_ID=218684 /ORGANISM="Corethron pennatum, Strain L29A3" /LENGTH=107 /DNA_ID=CAMNT_0039050519 /DNA_START=320 /DNA_END=646 /DNA_ORIENTATION=-